MRTTQLSLMLLAIAGCETTVVCSLDDDCGELSYCYKALLENVDDEAAQSEPGYPYQAEGTCRSDCTSDADCFNGARCTPRGICRDPREGGGVQWRGRELGLSELLEAWEFSPVPDCKVFLDCALIASNLDELDDCALRVDPPAETAVLQVLQCFKEECPDANGWGDCAGINGACYDEAQVCRTQKI